MTALADPVRVLPSRLRTGAPWWLLAFVAVLPVVVLRAGTLAESDTFWEVRTGLWILDHRTLPTVETWSWTAAGTPWQLNSWLFDVIVAVFYRAGGLPAVAVGCAMWVAVIFGLVLVLARRLGASPFLAGLLLLLASPFLTEWVTARPQLADYTAVLLLVLLLQRLAARPRLLLLAAVLAVTVVWVNLHSASTLGVGIAATATAAAFARRATRPAAGWLAAATVVTAAGSLVNPYGWAIVTQTLTVRAAAAGITEWQPLQPLALLYSIPVAAGIGAVLLVRRDPVLAAALTVSLAGAVVAVRVVPVVLLLTVPALAVGAGVPAVTRYLASRRVMLSRGAVVAVAAFAVVAAAGLTHAGQPDPARYSPSVVARIPAGCRLVNTYMAGGLVLLQRPDVRVSIDTRTDVYGAAAVNRSVRVESGAVQVAAATAGAGCVLMPQSSGLARALTGAAGWRVAASDGTSVLFLRV